MSDRYWNASRPQFVNGEPREHLDAKEKVAQILRKEGRYDHIEFEYKTPYLKYRDRYIPFFVDIKAYNRTINHTILVQLDGGYHYSGRYRGKTRNRDDALRPFCYFEQYGYAVLDVNDVLLESENWVLTEIWKQIAKNKLKAKRELESENKEN